VRHASPGEVIVRQGEIADALYVIVHGTFEVTAKGTDSVERSIRMLAGGRCFGELGLLDGAPRTASVIARTDGELLVLTAADVRYLLDGAAAARRTLAAEAAERRLQLARRGIN
jgi:CRP-like cAMP-binding protein